MDRRGARVAATSARPVPADPASWRKGDPRTASAFARRARSDCLSAVASPSDPKSASASSSAWPDVRPAPSSCERR